MISLAPSRVALLVALVAVQPLAALAQAPAATPTPKAAPTSDTALPKDAATQLEQHNKRLHDQLGITAQQQPEWDKFTGVMRSNAFDMRRVMTERGAKLDTMNASENMQSFADMSRVHAANMEKAASAFQSLYAALSPQQKAVADRVFRNQAEKRAAKKG